MAKLEDIASILKVDIKSQHKTLTPTISRSGKKRRPWFESEEDSNKTLKNRENQKTDPQSIKRGGINLIDQPYLSTGSINQVDSPLLKKGAINPVSKPITIEFESLRSNPLKLMLFLARNVKNGKEKTTRK